MALAISYPSAHAEIFRMTCTPDSSSIPYTVTYDSGVGASYITGGRSGTTRKYNVLNIKNKTSVHVLYVATKAPNQLNRERAAALGKPPPPTEFWLPRV